MSIHVCKCIYGGKEEYHLRYPGLSEKQAQLIADKINAGCLYSAESSKPEFNSKGVWKRDMLGNIPIWKCEQCGTWINNGMEFYCDCDKEAE